MANNKGKEQMDKKADDNRFDSERRVGFGEWRCADPSFQQEFDELCVEVVFIYK